MTEKTASILDFIKAPVKQSSSVYEVLAKEASDAFIDQQVVPDQTIARLAADRSFNEDQIHRVVELTNHQINNRMSKSADDQLFTFPVATVGGVKKVMGDSTSKTGMALDPMAAEVEKAASLIDWGVYDQLQDIPDYVSVLRSYRFEQRLDSAPAPTMPKAASAPEAYRKNELEYIEKRAHADFDYAYGDLQSSVAQLRQEWDKLASTEDRAQFMGAACHILGPDSMKKLASRFGDTAVTSAATIDPDEVAKIAGYLDTEHPIVVRLVDVRERFAALGKTAGVLQDVHKLVGQRKESETRQKWASVFPERLPGVIKK